MGLLEQVLGGGMRGGGLRGGRMRQSGGNRGRLLMLLLPLVLRALRNRQRGGGGRAGGGLGGPLGAAIASGGLGALIQRMTQRGFGPQAESWVASGPNQPLPAAALDGELDEAQLSEIATEAGVSPAEVREGLAELLPEVVDDLTPDGRIPDPEEIAASVEAFEQRLPA
jgi:uncharacterized protein YidB (DUF937 family)